VEYRPGAPFDIATLNNRIYWTDRHSQLLKGRRIDAYSHDRAIFVGNFSQLGPVELSTPSKHSGLFAGKVVIMENTTSLLDDLKKNHECSTVSSKPRGCSHMCLMSEGKYKGTCACPEKFQLDQDRRTCIPVKTLDAPPFAAICSGGRCRTTTATTTTTIAPVDISGRAKGGVKDNVDKTEDVTPSTPKPCKGKKCDSKKEKKPVSDEEFSLASIFNFDDNPRESGSDYSPDSFELDRELRREQQDRVC